MSDQRSAWTGHSGRAGAALPTFIIIGAMKCGTTSLHEYLSMHPQISASAKKELDFFINDEAFSRGIDWYASHFDAGRTVRGESSPNYSKAHLFPDVPRRMHAVIPDCKLIYVVRDPIERAISHYLHGWVAERESRPIAEAFRDLDNNNYALTGRYAYQLERFLEYYPRDRVLVLLAEDLRRDRMGSLSRVFRFLEVDDGFVSEGFEEVHHATSGRPGVLATLVRRHASALVRTTRRILPGSTVDRLRRLVTTPAPTVTIEPELRARLAEYYRPDVLALSSFLGGRIPPWL